MSRQGRGRAGGARDWAAYREGRNAQNPFRPQRTDHPPPIPHPSHPSLIAYCKSTRDVLVPSVWGPLEKKEDPYSPAGAGGCGCRVM